MYYIVELEENQKDVKEALEIIFMDDSIPHSEIVFFWRSQDLESTSVPIPEATKLLIGSDQYNKRELFIMFKLLYGEFMLVSLGDLSLSSPSDEEIFDWNKLLENIFDKRVSYSEVDNSFENLIQIFKAVFSTQRMAILNKEYLSPLRRFLNLEKKFFQLDGGNERRGVIQIGVMDSSIQAGVFTQLQNEFAELKKYLISIDGGFHQHLVKLIGKRLFLLKQYETLRSDWVSSLHNKNFPLVFLWHMAFLDRLSLMYKQNGEFQIGVLFLVRSFEYFLTGYLFYKQIIFQSGGHWLYDDFQGNQKKVSGAGQLFYIFKENFGSDHDLRDVNIPVIGSMISIRNASYVGHGAAKFKSCVYDELYSEVSKLIKLKLQEVNSYGLFDELRQYNKMTNESLSVKSMWKDFYNRIGVVEV